jgi:predicted transcriptional regulator
MKTPSTKYIKKTIQDTIIRINFDNGNYATISNKVMNDEKITSDAFRLLTIMLNKADSWDIQVGYIGRQLGWDSRRVTKAVTNLEENGYLTKVGKSKGSKGFEYTYTVSEYGDLTPLSTKAEPTPVIEKISQPEASNTEIIVILDCGKRVTVPSKFNKLWIELPTYKQKEILKSNYGQSGFNVELEELEETK